MKLLTFSSMAIVRLKANKRQYLSLVLGVLMSIFIFDETLTMRQTIGILLAIIGIILINLGEVKEK